MLLLLLGCGEDTKDSLDTAIEDTSVEDTDTDQPVEDQDGDGFSVADGDCNDEDVTIFPFDRTAHHGSVGCGWEVSSGVDYVCGLSSAGTISCWGEDNGSGNLDAPEGTFVELSVGTGHACARDANNMVTCWGWGTYGQTGESEAAGSILDTPLKSISAGAYQTCGIDLNDVVHCMGGYSYYNWDWDGIAATSLNTSSYHACVVTTDSNIACVVPTDDSGDLVVNEIPAAPEETYVTVASIDANESCALASQGFVVCWGDIGQTYSPPGTDVVALEMGSMDHYCALSADQSVTCWGDVWPTLDQGQASSPEGTFQSLGLGQYHSCGVRTTGDIHCWGSIDGNPVHR